MIDLLINKFRNKAIFFLVAWSTSFHLEGEFWEQAEPGGASRALGAEMEAVLLQAASREEGLAGAAQPARSCDFSLHPCSLPLGSERWHS